MTVFKTFWQVVKKYKGTIILYTVLLVVFGGMNMSTNDTSTIFVDSKPSVFIINRDENKGITENLIKYIGKNVKIVSLKNDEEAINDALFYRDVNYIIYIPQNYREDILNGKNPTIDIKTTGDYQASLAQMILTRYSKIQNIYRSYIKEENTLIKAINDTLDKKTEVEISSTINTNKTSKMALYFNFASYSIMAVIIFVICLVLSSFHELAIQKRTIISSMNYKKHNRQLLLSSFLYVVIVWILFIILGIILIGSDLLSIRGIIYMINALIFSFCSLTIAILLSTLIHNKEALSGIVNVIALGSSFLCGAFVPAEWLPSSVLTFAHALPSYWYIRSNDLLKSIEVFQLQELYPIIFNMIIIIIFSIIFIALNNVISKYKQRVG